MTDDQPVSDRASSRPPEGDPPKTNPEELALRTRPRPVTRINRRVLMVLVGAGSLLVLGATIFALDPPSLFDRKETGSELYNVTNKPTPEGLQRLPSRYSELAPPPVELGPPLPGDLGGAVLDLERVLGVTTPPQTTPNLPFRPNPEDDALRAERIRQARLAQQGRESGVFFQLAMRQTGQAGTAGERPGDAPVGSIQTPDDVLSMAVGRQDPWQFDRSNDQNLQGRKLNFLEQGTDPAIYNPHALQDPISPYQVMAGTVIAASLITGINSDLPGRVIAQVTENVYDAVTGGHLLIPQGARLIGSYDSVIAFGQDRALVVWQRIIMPDGSSVVIENLPATGTGGYAGLVDEVDFHTWRLLKGIVLSTLLGVGTELTFGEEESDLVSAIRESSQDSANQAGQRITERNLNIQPTITIRPGWPLRVIVHKDLVLRPYRG